MPKIALVSSEPLRERVAGIGLRYLELARRLPGYGIDVVAVSPADPGETPLPEGTVRRFAAGRLSELLADCDGAVAQGQLANDLLLECPELPVAIDLYDPWLVENLHYAPELGLDPYRNDHATWVLQLSRGDFFLCSSEEQRLFYSGFLAALGRVNPRRLAADPDLAGLIAPVPFGVPEELPPHRPFLEPAGPEPGARRLLFGALYDWYDPWTLLDALELLERRRGVGEAAGPPPGASCSSATPTPRARLSACSAKSRRAAGSAAGGGAGSGRSTGCPATAATICSATSTCWSRPTGRASRPGCRSAPGSSTPSPPAARS